MSTTPLIPQSFWFRLAFPCLKVENNQASGKGAPPDLPEECRLFETSRLDGEEPWADVRVAWSRAGLAVQVGAKGGLPALPSDDRAEGPYAFRAWIDTRDTRDVSRATRFCHRFDARLTKGAGPKGLGAIIEQKPIARALADAPTAKTHAPTAQARRTRTGWRLDLFFPAEALNGFDPDTNRRLGFAYQVTDPERADQFLGVGREFPVGENPSLWSTLELREPD